MTNDTMDLQALVGKSPDADFLRDMIGFAATRLMELEVGALTGAAYGEKDADRLAQRVDRRATRDPAVIASKSLTKYINSVLRGGVPRNADLQHDKRL